MTLSFPLRTRIISNQPLNLQANSKIKEKRDILKQFHSEEVLTNGWDYRLLQSTIPIFATIQNFLKKSQKIKQL
jgi:hypothetical protein